MSLYLLLDKAEWYLFDFSSPLSAFKTVALWLTVAVAIAYALCALLVKGENRGKVIRYFSLAVIAYACVIGAVLLVWTFVDDGIKVILFVPLLLLILAALALAVSLFVVKNKLAVIVFAALVVAAFVAVIVCMTINYNSGEPIKDNWIEDPSTVKPVPLYISAVLCIAAVIAAAFLIDRRKMVFDSKSLSFAGVCIAMSFALSYLRVVKMPQGGSITIASLLPLMVYSYMFGPKKGVFAGMIYGLLQAIQDNYIINLPQFMLDYPIAFACIGLAGAFANVRALDSMPQVKFALGAVVAGLARFVMHFLSGVFAFGEFAYGQNVVLYSLSYQAGYVLPDIAIVVIVGVIVFSSKSFVSAISRYGAPSSSK